MPVAISRRYNRDWEQTAQLRDGTHARLRLVRPEDKRLFQEAFTRLSQDSRYRRFFAAKSALTDRDLRYLTELDSEQHFALGAIRGEGDAEQGLGVARFVRLPDSPDVAEAAVVVTDDVQGQGLGQALLNALVVAARERGVRTFECLVMQGNQPVLSLLREHVPAATLTPQPDGSVTVRVPLDEISAPETPARGEHRPIFHLLRLAAREALEVRHRLAARWLAH